MDEPRTEPIRPKATPVASGILSVTIERPKPVEATNQTASPDANGGPKAGGKGKRAKGPRPKHVPVRMCVACRERDSKRGLTRIVRTPEGSVEIDPTGRKNGRGSYLCDNPGCWDKAIKGGLLTRALNTTIPVDAIEHLRQHGAELRAAQPTTRPEAAPPDRPKSATPTT